MNKRLVAKLYRNNALKAVLTAPANAAILTPIKPIANEVGACIASFSNAETKALSAGITYEGYTVNRDLARVTLAHEAAIICGNGYLRLNRLNRHDLAAQLHIHETDYLNAGIEQAAQIAQNGHDVLFGCLADLGDYVTAGDLTSLQGFINALNLAEGLTLSLHQASPAELQAAETAIRQTDEDIDNLRIAIRPLQKTNLSLYNTIVLNCMLPPVNIHHTYLTVAVTDANTHEPLIGATLTADTKTATTKTGGIGVLEKVKAGTVPLQIAAPGKPVKEVICQVKRGKNNSVSVEV